MGIDGNLFLLLELATAFGEDPREGGINIFAVVGVCLRVSVVWSDGRLKATCGAMARVVKTAKCAVAHIALALAAASGSHGGVADVAVLRSGVGTVVEGARWVGAAFDIR